MVEMFKHAFHAQIIPLFTGAHNIALNRRSFSVVTAANSVVFCGNSVISRISSCKTSVNSVVLCQNSVVCARNSVVYTKNNTVYAKNNANSSAFIDVSCTNNTKPPVITGRNPPNSTVSRTNNTKPRVITGRNPPPALCFCGLALGRRGNRGNPPLPGGGGRKKLLTRAEILLHSRSQTFSYGFPLSWVTCQIK